MAVRIKEGTDRRTLSLPGARLGCIRSWIGNRSRHDDIALWIISHRKDVLTHFEKPEFLVERDRSWISMPNAEPDHV